MAAKVDMNVLRRFGHVVRIDNERLMKRVLDGRVDGRYVRGRHVF